MRRQLKPTTCVIFVVLGALVLLPSCNTNDTTQSSAPKKNVLLIGLDTVRADRFGCYGNPDGITPEIDKWTQGAVKFERAFAHAPWTLPSFASLFTSRYPGWHGAGGRLGAFRRLPDQAVTIAEVFKRAGSATGAIVNVDFLTETFGMTQGFDSVDADAPSSNVEVRRAGPTTDVALRWIDQHRDRPFFLFVHYFDPHLIYDPPQPFRGRFADPQDRDTDDPVFGTRADVVGLRSGRLDLDPDKIARLEKLYDGEVAYVDAEVGRLLAGIADRGLEADTIVVITSDHGEEFHDHGGFEHGHTLYDELLHVPLIIRAPGWPATAARAGAPEAGRVVASTVRHIDVAPTLCQLADISVAAAFAGKSLVPLMEGGPEDNRPLLSQGNFWGPSGDAWRKDRFKLIRQAASEATELYNLAADPKEQRDVAAENPELTRRMLDDLRLIKQTLGAQAAVGRRPTLSREQADRLRSLGYMK